jgi:hypothetical protein
MTDTPDLREEITLQKLMNIPAPPGSELWYLQQLAQHIGPEAAEIVHNFIDCIVSTRLKWEKARDEEAAEAEAFLKSWEGGPPQ